MITAPFDYVRAGSVDEALALLDEHGDDAKLLAGGHSLLPMMKMRLAQPAVLIDLGGIAELRYLRADGDMLAIGALTTHDQVATSAAHPPGIAAARPLGRAGRRSAGPAPRHPRRFAGARRSGGGPADGRGRPAPLSWSRRVPAGGGRSPSTTSSPDRSRPLWSRTNYWWRCGCPADPTTAWGYQKFVRRANDWAIVGVAAVADRIVLANMGGRPLRAAAAEAAKAAGAPLAEVAAAGR